MLYLKRAALVLGALGLFAFAPCGVEAQVLALSGTPPLAGNQDFNGNVGMDFVVNLPIDVTALGVFDSDQDGVAAGFTLNVDLWQRDDGGTPDIPEDDTGVQILAADAFTGSAGTLNGVYRTSDLVTPLTLQPGAYTINAYGYGADEQLHNLFDALEPTVNDSNGAIQFVGRSRWGVMGAGTFPEVVDTDTPTRYFSATFAYLPPASDAFVRIDINRDTGAITLVNGTADPLDLLGYSIGSASGALNPAEWTPIAGNHDAAGDGSVDPDDTWTVLTGSASRADLSEYELVGGDGGTLAASQSVALGNGAWIKSPFEEDVTLQYASPDGTIVAGIVQFTGNDGEPFEFGDLNFDGTAFALDDFTDGLLPNLVSTLPGLSAAEAYQLGDLDSDLDVDQDDFRMFKESFLAAGGAPAALAAAASVPEPSTFALVCFALLGGCLMLGRARIRDSVRRLLGVALVAACFSSMSTRGEAQTIALDNPLLVGDQAFGGDLGMDFVVNEFSIDVVSLGAFDSGQDGLQRDITVELWSRNDGGTPEDPNDDAGIAILTTDLFTGADPGTLIGGSRFKTLAAPLTLDQGAYTIVARGYGDEETNGNVNVGELSTINDMGGIIEFVGLARWDLIDTFPLNVDGGPANRYLAGTFAYEFSQEPLKLEVDTTTGAVAMLNGSDISYDFDFYEVTSASGSLDPTGWNSLEDQAVAGWLEGGASDASSLAEANLTASSSLAPTESLSLGSAYDTGVDAQDVAFTYVTPSGILLEGAVEYVSSPFLLGDVNLDTVVNGLDVDPFVDVLLNGPFQIEADMNQDGEVNGLDVDPFVAAVVGGGVQAVPEPSTLVLLSLAALIGLAWRQR